MLRLAILVLAAAVQSPTATPTRTPWAPRRAPTPREIVLAEPTPAPVEPGLSGIAGRIKLKRDGKAEVRITGSGAGSCTIPLELRQLPQPATIGEVGAAQVGRAIRVWFWILDEAGKEIRTAMCTTLEIWSREQQIYHFEVLLLPDNFSDVALGGILRPQQHHIGIVFRDRVFEELLEPPGSAVNIVVRVRAADDHSFQGGTSLYLTP